MNAYSTRILFFVSNLSIGGAEQHTVRLAYALQQRGHCVTVAVLSPSSNRMADIPASLDIQEVDNNQRGSRNRRRARFARSLITKIQPDVIFGVNDMATAIAAIASYRCPCRLVMIQHANTRHLTSYRGRVLIKALGWLSLVTIVSPRIEQVVYVSASQKKSWRYMPPFSWRPGRVNFNGVDTRRSNTGRDEDLVARLATFSCGPHHLKLCVVAALRPEKRHEVLLRAIARLKADGIVALLAVAGDGPMATDIRERIDALGLSEQVLMLGAVRDVSTLYRWSDTSVLASSAESCSLAIAESMACGTPVIATQVGGNGEQIVDGESGYLVSVNNPDSLAAGVRRMLDRGVRLALGAAARRRAVESFSFEGMVDQYGELLRVPG